MLKFKYHYLTNTLFIQNPPETTQWHQISPDKHFTGNFQAQGFILEPDNHWISFQVKADYLQVFYKFPEEASKTLTDLWAPEKATYFKKYLAKEAEVVFTFTSQDEVEKISGRWVKKGGSHD